MNTEDAAAELQAQIDHYTMRIDEAEHIRDGAEKDIKVSREFVRVFTSALEKLKAGAATGAAEPAPRVPKKKPGEVEQAVIDAINADHMHTCDFDGIVRYTGLNRGSLRQAVSKLRKAGTITVAADGRIAQARDAAE